MPLWLNLSEKQKCLNPGSKIIKDEKADQKWINHKNQQNFCVKLCRQIKGKYFSDINVKSVSDSKKV